MIIFPSRCIIIFVLLCFLMRFNSRQEEPYFKLAINQINTVFYLHRDATTDLSIRFTTNFFNPSYATARLLLNLSSQRRLYTLYRNKKYIQVERISSITSESFSERRRRDKQQGNDQGRRQQQRQLSQEEISRLIFINPS